ncbi:MAG: hemerythrin domain-containing protein [Mycobacteriales bacterium]
MTSDALGEALAREHHAIDEALEGGAAQEVTGRRRSALKAASAALRRHIWLEEELLFPAMYATGDTRLVTPMMTMLREHGQLWQRLASLEGELDQHGQAAVGQTCHRLLIQLQHHNRSEERVVYAAVDRSLPPQVVDRVAACLESGRMPAGWVCLKARR